MDLLICISVGEKPNPQARFHKDDDDDEEKECQHIETLSN